MCMTAVSLSVTKKSLPFFFPLPPIRLTHTVHMCGILHGRTLLKNNSSGELLHRWLIETIIVLVLLSFIFTWNSTTTENTNSHMLRDFLQECFKTLPSYNYQQAPSKILELSTTAMPHQVHSEKIWESWDPGVMCDFQLHGMKLVLNHHIKTTVTAPAHPSSPEMANLLTVFSKPSGISHVFRKFCFQLITDLSNCPQPPTWNPKKPKTY